MTNLKICTKCSLPKDVSEFYTDRASCKVCWDASNKKYIQENPHIARAISKRYRESPKARDHRFTRQKAYRIEKKDQLRNSALLYRYGITLEQFTSLLQSQSGQCKTCGTINPGKKGWNTDHDHNCCLKGRRKCIRGLLCSACNFYLGRFEKNLARLFKDVQYLSVGVIA